MADTTRIRELALQRLQSQLDALPDGDPKKTLLTEIVRGKSVEHGARSELLRKLASERFHALADNDPLKTILGRMLGEDVGESPAPMPADNEQLNKQMSSLWSAIRTIDSRASAAMQEAQRIAARLVEMQELLNLVLEEVHTNTEMIRAFNDEHANG